MGAPFADGCERSEKNANDKHTDRLHARQLSLIVIWGSKTGFGEKWPAAWDPRCQCHDGARKGAFRKVGSPTAPVRSCRSLLPGCVACSPGILNVLQHICVIMC